MAKKQVQIQKKITSNQNSGKSRTDQLLKALRKIQSSVQVVTIDSLNDIPFWLSTGDDVLDLFISNRKNGGIPGSRISSIDGLQQSGKSLVCSHLIKSCQQQGGYTILFDTQNASSKDFMRAIGVNIQDVLIYQGLNLVQKIFSIIQQALYAIRLQMPDVPLLIIIDSLTACVTQKDLQNVDYQNKGFLAGLRAKMIGQALRKLTPMIATQKACLVITNQVRAKMDMANPFMDPYVASSGGMALPFYTTIQIRLQKKSKLKEKVHGVESVVGVRTKARIDKSRLGAAYRECQFSVYYDAGIDNYSNWLQTLKKYGLVEGKGTKNIPWVINFQGKQIVVPGNFNKYIRQNPSVRSQIYDVLSKLLILTYKNIADVDQRQIIQQGELVTQEHSE